MDLVLIIAYLADKVIIDITLQTCVIVMKDIMKFQNNHNV